jgi:hypothetical protein
MVKATYVNLVDLVHVPNSAERLVLFDSEDALSRYTKETGKWFPRENAYAGGLLKYLLRDIVIPGTRSRGRGIHRVAREGQSLQRGASGAQRGRLEAQRGGSAVRRGGSEAQRGGSRAQGARGARRSARGGRPG